MQGCGNPQSEVEKNSGHGRGMGRGSSEGAEMAEERPTDNQSTPCWAAPACRHRDSCPASTQSPVSALRRTQPRSSRSGGVGGGSPRGPLGVPGVVGATLCVFHQVRGPWVTSTRKGSTELCVIVMSIIPTLGKLRQKDYGFEVNLGTIARPSLKRNKGCASKFQTSG